MLYLSESDLTGIAPDRARELVEAVEAEALHVAPCLADSSRLTDAQRTWVKVRLRRIARRWDDMGAGALSSSTRTAGSVSVSETYDTRSGHPGSLWKSEVVDFVDLCRRLESVAAPAAGAYTIDMTGLGVHRDPLAGVVINRPEPEAMQP